MFGSAIIVFHEKYLCLLTTLNRQKERNLQQNSERLQKNHIFCFVDFSLITPFFYKLNKVRDMLHSDESVIPDLGLTDHFSFFSAVIKSLVESNERKGEVNLLRVTNDCLLQHPCHDGLINQYGIYLQSLVITY